MISDRLKQSDKARRHSASAHPHCMRLDPAVVPSFAPPSSPHLRISALTPFPHGRLPSPRTAIGAVQAREAARGEAEGFRLVHGAY